MLEPKMILAYTKFECFHSLLLMRRAFDDTFIVNADYSRKDVISVVVDEGRANLVVYSRLFLANLDLSRRFEFDTPLNTDNGETFYTRDFALVTVIIHFLK
ncbi:hypothetical protein ACOSQ2_009507 [Xanthoceras sorbifolium]